MFGMATGSANQFSVPPVAGHMRFIETLNGENLFTNRALVQAKLHLFRFISFPRWWFAFLWRWWRFSWGFGGWCRGGRFWVHSSCGWGSCVRGRFLSNRIWFRWLRLFLAPCCFLAVGSSAMDLRLVGAKLRSTFEVFVGFFTPMGRNRRGRFQRHIALVRGKIWKVYSMRKSMTITSLL